MWRFGSDHCGRNRTTERKDDIRRKQCGTFKQTVAKERLRKQISTEKLLSIRSASRTLPHNAEVNTSLRCYATLQQLIDTQQ
jgi:hypothetical protein